MGAKGFARAKVDAAGNWAQSPLQKTISIELRTAINAKIGAKENDLLFFQFGKESTVQTVLANLRVHLAKKLGLIPESGHGGNFEFLWVVNPPLFEWDDDRKSWVAAHHAFTRPHDECVDFLETDPGKVLCHRYDLVLNGFEIGGGSIRLHDPSVQARCFAPRHSDTEARANSASCSTRFATARRRTAESRWAWIASRCFSRAPIAPRRDSIPKTQKGTDLMTDAPSEVTQEQLAEVFVRVIKPS